MSPSVPQYKPEIDVNELPVVDTRPMTDMVNAEKDPLVIGPDDTNPSL